MGGRGQGKRREEGWWLADDGEKRSELKRRKRREMAGCATGVVAVEGAGGEGEGGRDNEYELWV